jgi:hypothetical protein
MQEPYLYHDGIFKLVPRYKRCSEVVLESDGSLVHDNKSAAMDIVTTLFTLLDLESLHECY